MTPSPRRGVFFVALFALVWVLSIESAAAVPQQEASVELTVSGTVREPGSRDPVAGERVELVGPRGERVPGRVPVRPPSRETVSDENGRFRFDGVLPGEYTLDVPDAVQTTQDRQRRFELVPGPPSEIDLWSYPRAFVSGRVTDADGNPVSAAVSLVQPLYSRGRWGFFSSGWFGGRTDADGRYEIEAPPGRYYLRLSVPVGPELYYPDEVDLARAALISVDRGTVMPEMNFVYGVDVGLRIRFEFPLPPAPPDVADIPDLYLSARRLSSDLLEIETSPGFGVALERVDGDGYQTAPLPSGEYELTLRYSRELIEAMPEVDWSGLEPILRRTVVLEDEDRDLGLLSPDVRASIEGRVVVEGEQAAEFDLASLPEFQFRLWPNGGMTFIPEVGADGRFVVESVFPEQYHLSYNALRPPTNWMPEGWYLRAITAGGQDVLTDGLTVPSGANLSLDIHVASGSADVAGVVRLANDEPGAGALVLLIPPQARWGSARTVPSALAEPSGRYEIPNVAPGDYRLLALDLAGRGTTILFWEDPGFLLKHAFRGAAVTIEPGEELVRNLEALPLED